MDFEEARKKVAAKKVPGNYLKIRLDYSTTIVLPYKDGLAFLQAFEHAEEMNDRDFKHTRIVPLRERFHTEILSATEYQAYKMAALLDQSPAEIFTMLRSQD